MKLKQQPLINGGMSQDKSISKEDNTFAYKNRNIKITASEEGTLLSVTNYRGGKFLIPIIDGRPSKQAPTIPGVLLTYCVTPEYLVLFTKSGNTDFIFRVDLNSLLKNSGSFETHTLYKGTDLNFHTDRTYDTLYHEENANIKKVYWCEDWRETNSGDEDNNNLRFINIITEGERFGGSDFTSYTSNEFEFYPVIGKAPRVKVQKKYDQESDFPSGVVQYFFTYYNANGAETKICQDSPLITLTSKDRGSNIDEKPGCVIKINIYDYSQDFDYIRIYSAVRSSLNGAMRVNITADIEIPKNTDPGVKPLLFIDNYKAQEQIEANQLYFIGGTPIAAKTIEQKQGTLFAGNIHTSHISLPNELKELFKDNKDNEYSFISKDGNHWSRIVKFTRKGQEYLVDDVLKDSHSLLFWDEDFSDKVSTDGKLPLFPGSTIKVPVIEYLSYYFDSGNAPGKGRTFIDSFGDDEIKAEGYVLRKAPKHSVYKQTDYSVNGDSIYPYTLSTDSSNIRYTGFKYGEIYRFGLQFQDKTGQWTEVLYIGDGECRCTPAVDKENKNLLYTNAIIKLPQEVIDICKKYNYVNYKVVIADPDLSNGRNVIAQGILCPTLFSPLNRYMKTNWVFPSWNFRPINGDLPYHHFQRLAPYWDRTAEIANIRGDETISDLPEDAQVVLANYREQAQKDASSTNLTMNKRRVSICIISPRDDTAHTTHLYLISCVMSVKCYNSNFTEDTNSIEDCKIVQTKINSYSSIPTSLISLADTMSSKTVNYSPSPAIQRCTYWNWENNLNALVNNHYNSIQNLSQIIFLVYAKSNETVPSTFKWSDVFNYKYILSIKDKIADYDNEYKLSSIDAKNADWVKKGKVNKDAFTTKLYFYDALRAYQTFISQEWIVLPTKKGDSIVNDKSMTIEEDWGKDSITTNLFNLSIFFDKFNGSVEKEEDKIHYNKNNIIRDLVNVNATQYDTSFLDPNMEQSKQISTYMNNDALFVDNSVVTFHSPDFDSVEQVKNNSAKLSIVGASYINKNYARRVITAGVSMTSFGGIQDYNAGKYITANNNTEVNTLISEYSLMDHYLQKVKGEPSDKDTDKGKLINQDTKESLVINKDDAAFFMTHPWEITGSISGICSNNTEINGIKENGLYKEFGTVDFPNTVDYDVIKSNNTYNYKIAEQTSYVVGKPTNNYITDTISIAYDGADATNLKVSGFNTFLYTPKVEKTILGKSDIKYVTGSNYTVYPNQVNNTLTTIKPTMPNITRLGLKVGDTYINALKKLEDYITTITNIDTDSVKLVSNACKTGPVRITYNTTSHAVFSLGSAGEYLKLLPVASGDKKFDNDLIYTGHTNNTFYSKNYKNKGVYPWSASNGFDFKRLVQNQLLSNFCELTVSNVKANEEKVKSALKKASSHQYVDSDDLFVYKVKVSENKYKDITTVRDFIDNNQFPLLDTINEFLIVGNEVFNIKVETTSNNKYALINKPIEDEDGNIIPGYTDSFVYMGINIIDKYKVDILYGDKNSNGIREIKGITISYKVLPFSIKIKRFWHAPRNRYYIEYDVVESKNYYYNGSDVTTFAYGNNIDKRVTKKYNFYDVPDNVKEEIPYWSKTGEKISIGGVESVFQAPHSVEFIKKCLGQVIISDPNEYMEYLDAAAMMNTVYSSVTKITNDNPLYSSDKCDVTIDNPVSPFLYIGELRRNIPHEQLYGGFSESALQNLIWIPASNYTSIEDMVYQTIGDTYFQRYDCIKSYPTDDEGINKVTDIVSVMIETHTNLDTRTDVNRWNFNTQARPDNFGLYNTVYNQKNNIFTGSVLPELVNQAAFKSTYVWSLNKNYAGRVDTWTNLSANSSARTRNEITKIVNWGKDALFALEHNCIELINFKERNLINTTSGMQINVDFNDKVYTLPLNLNYGTHCSNVLTTDLGVYFVDDNKNTLVLLSADGNCVELPFGRMEAYFKDTITISKEVNAIDSIRFFYDSIHKDVYIIIRNPNTNSSECIVYNEILKVFTSFVDAPNLSLMLSYGGKVFAYNANQITDNHLSMLSGYTMFEGTYNQIFDKYVPYSIEYRVSPGEYTFTDKVFTNVEFLADLGVSKDNSTTTNVQPFANIRVWDEYQDTGIVPLQYDRSSVTRSKVISNLQQKFRTWRAIVPRDKVNQRDRIRNPWVHLYLDGNPQTDCKLELHNIVMDYYE